MRPYLFAAPLALALLGQLSRIAAPPPPRWEAERDPSFAVHDSVLAQLSGIVGMALAPDGSLFLSDFRFPAVLHLERSGSLRRVVGRRGGGPGEFYSAIRVGLHRDSLWVLDPGQVRLTLFAIAGRGVTTVPYGILAHPVSGSPRPQSRRGVPVGILSDGSLLLQENVPVSDNPAEGYLETLLLRADRGLGVLDTITRFSTRHSSLAFVYEDGESHFTQPFGDDALYEVSSDGGAVAMVTRTVARGREEQIFTLTVWRGSPARRVVGRLTYRPRPLPANAVDSMVHLMVRPREDGPRTPITEDSIRARLFRPGYYPPVERLSVARDGSVWLKVRFADSPDTGSDWLKVSPDGRPAGRITLPARFKVLESDGAALYGAENDPDDVPHAMRFVVRP